MKIGLSLGLSSNRRGSGGGPVAPGDLWSDPATWAGTLGHVPVATDVVTIEVGQTIYLDVETASLAELHIEGTLIGLHAGPPIGITSELIMVMDGGELRVGTAAVPFYGDCTITLTGARSTHTARGDDNALNNDGMMRALMIEDGGTLCLHGLVPALLKTKLNAHAVATATTFTLADSVSWPSGDRIAIGMTDFYGVGATEQFVLASSTSGTAMTTVGALTTARWGVLQYPTDAGMSLTAGTFTPPSLLTPLVLDERAEVINLSRRIVIQGANDSHWTSDGFGGHCMVMGVTSTAKVKGVEFRRMGQRRAMGRYPFHWHMLSYTSYVSGGAAGGVYIDDVVDGDHYLKDCSIWDSENRAVTIHGTCGVEVDNCTAVDIQGHAFFLEDGSEERNTITNNVAMMVRDPGATNRLKAHDASASGFWLTNLNNVITDNAGSDCGGRGLWNSLAAQCFGLSRNVEIYPYRVVVDTYDDNTGHSNGQQGIMTDDVVTSEAGDTGGRRYLEYYGPGAVFEFTMRRNKLWKNNDGGYQNRVMAARYDGWTAADNNGKDFRGSTLGGAIMTGTLLVGSSLNNATAFAEPRRQAIASYHFELSFIDLTFIAYDYYAPTITSNGQFVYGGGVFDTSDLYTDPVSLGSARTSGWVLIDAHPGYLTPSPYFDGFALSVGGSPEKFRYWSNAGSIWDIQGLWGDAGNYLVFDDPFFTTGLSASDPVDDNNWVSTPDRFIGLGGEQFDRTVKAARLDSSNVEVGEHTLGDPADTAFLPNMRSFALLNGGRYQITYPDDAAPSTAVFFSFTNGYRSGDAVLLCLPWDGGTPVDGRLDAGYVESMTEVDGVAAGRIRSLDGAGANLAAVIADTSAETMWQDTSNDCVWVKFKGGLTFLGTSDPPEASPTDYNLYRPYFLRLRPA